MLKSCSREQILISITKPKKKHVEIGDKILIRPTKTTTKPPFDPLPYNVTQVNGNRITAGCHNKKRVCDKNHVKLLKDRPNYLKLSWDKTTSTCSTHYGDFDIKGKIVNKHVVTSSVMIPTLNLPGDLTPVTYETPTINESNKDTLDIPNPQMPSSKSSSSLFKITSEDQENMQSLLSNVFNSTTNSTNNTINVPLQNDSSQILRSHNIKLSWNKKLNSGPVVVRKGEKDNES